MAYFLKKSLQQNRLYLAIYESFYSPDTNGTKHKCIKSLGSVDKLIQSGIEDPISYYGAEVKKMNLERKQKLAAEKSTPQISDQSPERLLGYFPLAHVLNILDVAEHFRYMQSTRRFRFDLYDVFSSLVFARVVFPCSKNRTFHDVLPVLYKKSDFSYDQILEALGFMGSEYEKFVEILTVAVKENYKVTTKHTYFDCTNFYFEIDRENDFQAKGPSKENRPDPVVGMGLLLDEGMIPIGMKLYPGNQSEKPVLRDVIRSLKLQNNIDGRTVYVADKGLNCAENIIKGTNSGDGYLFSKSVKKLSSVEQTWVLLEDGYRDVTDSEGNILYRFKSCIDTFEYSYKDENGKTITKKVTEKRVATYNPKLARKKKIEIDRMVNKAKAMKMYAAKRSEFGESGKYINIEDAEGKKPVITINEKAVEKDRKLAGYNLLVTSELNMEDKEIYDTYHNLWRIEQSFRIMKSELDARPVFLQTEDSIKGHFLICYAAVLLERILEFYELHNAYSNSQINNFFREFRVTKIKNGRYINMCRTSKLIKELAILYNLPITNYYLTDKQIKMMHTR